MAQNRYCLDFASLSQTASPHHMSSHFMFGAVVLSTVRQGQKVLCVQDEAYLVTPGFESSSEG